METKALNLFPQTTICTWLILCLNLQAHTGGWDATVSGPSAFYPTIQDARGNILGACDPATGTVQWNKARVTAYGSIPEHRPRSLGEGVSLWESGSRQGRFPELSGLINYGWRYYQPMGGNFISPDLVYDPQNQSDFSFAGGDPINFVDPNGLFGKAAGSDIYSFEDRNTDIYARLGLPYYPTPSGLAYNERLAYTSAVAGLSYQQPASGFDLGGFAADAVLNAELLQQSWHEVRTPDFSTGWGRAAFGVAVVGLVAGTADAAANVMTFGGKSLATGAIKAGAKEIAEAGSKQLTETLVKDVGAYKEMGGHHIHAKKAFEAAAGYDLREALAVSEDALARYGVRHADITAAQQRLFREFAATGASNTLTAQSRIAYQALIEAGLPANVAKELVIQSQRRLIQSGAVAPTRIPWGGR